ncbi:MAG: hypothetical protein RLZZ70_353 [Candidatus Parcubacteria bacterium]
MDCWQSFYERASRAFWTIGQWSQAEERITNFVVFRSITTVKQTKHAVTIEPEEIICHKLYRRDATYTAPEGAQVTTSLEEAFAIAATENPTEIHIGGGANLYRQALPFVDRLHLTFFHDDKDGDSHFPNFRSEFVITHQSELQTYEGITFEWVDLIRLQ